MAIKLEVKDYCHNCGSFEPDVDKSRSMTMYNHATNCIERYNETIITCKDAERCEMMIEFLGKKMNVKGK